MATITLGIPFKLLQKFEDKKITVETSAGDKFRGVLICAEENMSISLSYVKATLVSGKTAEMENIYVKGSRVRLISLPDSAKDQLSALATRPSFRGGRGGFRGGRGGRGGRRPSFDRR